MKRSHPDDVHALLLTRILALPKGSPAGNEAFRDYQATRMLTVRPKLMAQKSLLERSLVSAVDHDAKVKALDDELAAIWWGVHDRIDDRWIALHPDANPEPTPEAPF